MFIQNVIVEPFNLLYLSKVTTLKYGLKSLGLNNFATFNNLYWENINKTNTLSFKFQEIPKVSVPVTSKSLFSI